MTDPTIASWSRENDLLFQLRQLREENERLKKEIANQDAMLERQTARIVDLQTHIENFDGEDR
jgi:predicted  nucleic acid-binding Zn-ribbon protein